MSDDPTLPAIVTAAVTPAPIPEGFSIPAAVALARDLAIGMYDVPVILRKHGVTAEQYATLQTVPYFQTVLKQQSDDWNAPKNGQQRLATQALAGLEEVLPDAIARVKVKNEPLQGIAQLLKVVADIGGVGGANKQPQAPSERFKITINLGADTEVHHKSKPSLVVESEALEAQPLTGGFGSLLSLSPEPEKA